MAIAPAAAFLRRVQNAQLIGDEEANIVEVALDSGKVEAAIAKKARGWGVQSVRNAGLLALTVLGTAAVGFAEHVGSEIATKSEVAHRVERLVVEGEKDLMDLLSHLPSDIKAALKGALDELRTMRRT